MADDPVFNWSLKDHRMNRTVAHGAAPSSDKAKGALLLALRDAGGYRPGMAGGVTRGSGTGGWFMRADDRNRISWEAWEPES